VAHAEWIHRRRLVALLLRASHASAAHPSSPPGAHRRHRRLLCTLLVVVRHHFYYSLAHSRCARTAPVQKNMARAACLLSGHKFSLEGMYKAHDEFRAAKASFVVRLRGGTARANRPVERCGAGSRHEYVAVDTTKSVTCSRLLFDFGCDRPKTRTRPQPRGANSGLQKCSRRGNAAPRTRLW
jgi:hypothetical protein